MADNRTTYRRVVVYLDCVIHIVICYPDVPTPHDIIRSITNGYNTVTCTDVLTLNLELYIMFIIIKFYRRWSYKM